MSAHLGDWEFDAVGPVIYKATSMAVRDPERYFDLRTVNRYLKNGTVTRTDYDEYLTKLEDVSEKIMERSAGGDDDGYEAAAAAQGEQGEQTPEQAGQVEEAKQAATPQAPAQAPTQVPAQAPAQAEVQAAAPVQQTQAAAPPVTTPGTPQ